ncbi:MAG: hypothetical protein IJT87_09160 [Ruminiclostridium sp.]|nr:hypothetical protein [Ruminiclostridium sp.]
MNIYVIIGIIGVISGILCARADVPLAWSGRRDDKADARSLGKIALWWTEVNESWFDKSFWLSCVGQPGTYLTMWFLAELIGQNNAGLALALKINTFIGAYTGLYFHGAVVTKYIVYRRLAGKISDDDAQTAINAIDKYPKIPSLISAVSLFAATTVIVTAAILTGALNVPVFMVVFNPVAAALILVPLQKLGLKLGGSLGFGFALFATVLITAGLSLPTI